MQFAITQIQRTRRGPVECVRWRVAMHDNRLDLVFLWLALALEQLTQRLFNNRFQLPVLIARPPLGPLQQVISVTFQRCATARECPGCALHFGACVGAVGNRLSAFCLRCRTSKSRKPTADSRIRINRDTVRCDTESRYRTWLKCYSSAISMVVFIWGALSIA